MRRHWRPWKSAVFRYLASVTEGLFWMGCGGLLLSLILWKAGMPSSVVMQLLTGLLWCMGAFLSGRRAGLHGRHHGIVAGLLCGGMLCLTMLTGVAWMGETMHRTHLLRMAMILLAGACGGMIGVNTRLYKPPD